MSLEGLEVDVAVKLAFVNNSLSLVEEYTRKLQDNAQKVKEQIQEAVERQVVSLRGRERQLMRQVEVVTAHQACLLGQQQASLVHSKGALTATQDLLNRCNPGDTTTLAKIKLDDTISQNVCPVNLVSVVVDEAAISAAVASLGQVQLPDTITHHSSPVIPAKAEDYEDEQHHVLHKSVAGESSGPDSPLRVTVTFPRLTNQNWLAQCKEKALASSQVSQTSNKMAARTGDVASWLNSLHLGGSQEEEEDQPATPNSLDSYDLLNNHKIHSVRTSECSSIEIVPNHFDSDKEESMASYGLCEIENVHQMIGEKSRWLCSDSSPEKLCLGNMKVSSACQANEMCSSFSKCIFPNNCGESALEKAQQSVNYRTRMNRKRTISKSEGTDDVLAHMANILASENSQWLLKDAKNSTVLPTPVKRAMYQLPSEMWLRQPSIITNPATPRVVLATHSNTWLLNKLKNHKEIEKQEKADSEKDEDENDCRITTKNLANALEKVTLSSPASTTVSVGKLSPTSDIKTWLLPKKNGQAAEALDNKLVELSSENKKRWLVYSSLKNSTGMGYNGDKSPPPLPEPVLAVAQAGISDWLIKRL